MPLEPLLEDVDAEEGLLDGPLVLLLLGPRHLVAVALEGGLPLGEGRRLLVVAGLDDVGALDEAVRERLQAALPDLDGLVPREGPGCPCSRAGTS